MEDKNRYITWFQVNKMWDRINLRWDNVNEDVNILVGLNGWEDKIVFMQEIESEV